MNRLLWLLCCLSSQSAWAVDPDQHHADVDTNPAKQAIEQPATSPVSDEAELVPDAAMLLFLAEWDQWQDGEWLGPEDFNEQNNVLSEVTTTDATTRNKQENTDENNPDLF